MALNNSDFPVVLISATGTETHHPTILEFSRFLYQVHLSYEIARLATDPEYASFPFPQHTFSPLTSRLQVRDRLRLEAVRHESPWRFKTTLIGIGAVAPTLWLLAQSLDKIGNYELNREKVRAEIQEIETRTRSERLSNVETATRLGVPLVPSELEMSLPRRPQTVLTPLESDRLRSMLTDREAVQFYERSQRTLKTLPFRVSDLDLEVILPGNSEHGKE
jgi:hypothetical protein